MKSRIALSIAALILFTITDLGEARIRPGGGMVAYTVTSINREKNNYVSRIYVRQINVDAAAPIDEVVSNDSMFS